MQPIQFSQQHCPEGADRLEQTQQLTPVSPPVSRVSSDQSTLRDPVAQPERVYLAFVKGVFPSDEAYHAEFMRLLKSRLVDMNVQHFCRHYLIHSQGLHSSEWRYPIEYNPRLEPVAAEEQADIVRNAESMSISELASLLNALQRFIADLTKSVMHQSFEKLASDTFMTDEEVNICMASPGNKFFLNGLVPSGGSEAVEEPVDSVSIFVEVKARLGRFSLLEALQLPQQLTLKKIENILLDVGVQKRLIPGPLQFIRAQLANCLDQNQFKTVIERFHTIQFEIPPFPTTGYGEGGWKRGVNPCIRPSHSFVITGRLGEFPTSIITSCGTKQGRLAMVSCDPEYVSHAEIVNGDLWRWRIAEDSMRYIELPFDPELVKRMSVGMQELHDVDHVSNLISFKKTVDSFGFFQRLKQFTFDSVVDTKTTDKLKSTLNRLVIDDFGQNGELLPMASRLVSSLEAIKEQPLTQEVKSQLVAIRKPLRTAIKAQDNLPRYGLITGATCQTLSGLAIHFLAAAHRNESNDIHGGAGQRLTAGDVRSCMRALQRGEEGTKMVEEFIPASNLSPYGKVILRGFFGTNSDEALLKRIRQCSDGRESVLLKVTTGGMAFDVDRLPAVSLG